MPDPDTLSTDAVDALAAIARALTPEENAAIKAYMLSRSTRWDGAEPADWLDEADQSDGYLDQIEPFFEAHPDEFRGAPGVRFALYALIALGQELTVVNVVRLLMRAGLVPGTPELPWTSVTLPPVRAVAGYQTRGEREVYLTGPSAGGAFLCRWPWIAGDHAGIWDMVQACRTWTAVSTPEAGRRLAEMFEAGEDLPEIGWFHGARAGGSSGVR